MSDPALIVLRLNPLRLNALAVAAIIVDLEVAAVLANASAESPAVAHAGIDDNGLRYWIGGHLRGAARVQELIDPVSTSGPTRIVSIRRIEYGSPLEFFLEVPWDFYASAGVGFLTALGLLFGAPLKAAATVHKSRAEYWRNRLIADQERARYLEWRASSYRNVELLDLEASPMDEPPTA